nr:MAG TPA: hypothetical protein [Caudoviricetes sp.]
MTQIRSILFDRLLLLEDFLSQIKVIYTLNISM